MSDCLCNIRTTVSKEVSGIVNVVDNSDIYNVRIEDSRHFDVRVDFQNRDIKTVLDSDGGTIRVRTSLENGSGGDVPVFTGNYTVTPKAHDATILHCRGYKMSSDVTVNKVPYFETSNQTGQTVYIANEV